MGRKQQKPELVEIITAQEFISLTEYELQEFLQEMRERLFGHAKQTSATGVSEDRTE